MSHTTFKKFLESREVLMRAVASPPLVTERMVINRYARFPMLIEGERVEVPVKPGQALKVKWLHEDSENPIAMRVELDSSIVSTTFSGAKLKRWIDKNTKHPK